MRFKATLCRTDNYSCQHDHKCGLQSNNHTVIKTILEKLTVAYGTKKYHVLYETRRFIKLLCRLFQVVPIVDRLCGLVVTVSGYRYRGPGFDPRRYQTF